MKTWMIVLAAVGTLSGCVVEDISRSTTSSGSGGEAGDPGPGSGGSGNAGGGEPCGELATDPQNCGECGHVCLETECQAGMCRAQIVGEDVAGIDSPARPVFGVDDVALFWMTSSTQTILATPKDGGEVVTYFETGNYAIQSVTLGPSHVYWYAMFDHGLRQGPKVGGTAGVLVDNDYDHGHGSDGSFVYYVDDNLQPTRVPVGGGVPEILDPTSTIYYDDLHLDGDVLYLLANGAVHTMPAAGGTPSVFLPTTVERYALEANSVVATHGTDCSGGSTDIYIAPKSGAAASMITLDQVSVSALAAADGYAYIANECEQKIQRVPLAGGLVLTLVDHVDAFQLEVQGEWLYAAVYDGLANNASRILRVPR
jgi:hypothetical protein